MLNWSLFHWKLQTCLSNSCRDTDGILSQKSANAATQPKMGCVEVNKNILIFPLDYRLVFALPN